MSLGSFESLLNINCESDIFQTLTNFFLQSIPSNLEIHESDDSVNEGLYVLLHRFDLE